MVTMDNGSIGKPNSCSRTLQYKFYTKHTGVTPKYQFAPLLCLSVHVHMSMYTSVSLLKEHRTEHMMLTIHMEQNI